MGLGKSGRGGIDPQSRSPFAVRAFCCTRTKAKASRASVALGLSQNPGRWRSARTEPRLLPGKSTPIERHLLSSRIILSASCLRSLNFRLERQGRLTHPLRWDKESDKYVPVQWEQAFRDIGHRLQACDPKSVVFYASGRASLETSYLYALMTRLYGSNNLPDCSNMCHESTSVALPESTRGACRDGYPR